MWESLLKKYHVGKEKVSMDERKHFCFSIVSLQCPLLLEISKNMIMSPFPVFTRL